MKIILTSSISNFRQWRSADAEGVSRREHSEAVRGDQPQLCQVRKCISDNGRVDEPVADHGPVHCRLSAK